MTAGDGNCVGVGHEGGRFAHLPAAVMFNP